MKSLSRLLFLMLTACLPACSSDDDKVTNPPQVVWNVTTVDAVPSEYVSLAMDGSGNPRISYYDGTNHDLKYAARNGGVWTLETVDESGDVGQFTSLALDAQGNPHISYYDNSGGRLKYATKGGGAWTREIVAESYAQVGTHTSIAVDALGRPHISYHMQDYFGIEGTLVYTVKSDGAWAGKAVDWGPVELGRYTSLKLNSVGGPTIIYHDGTGGIRCANITNGQWVHWTACSGGPHSSLAIDRQGNACLSYKCQAGDLRYLRYDAGTPHGELCVDTPTGAVTYNSLALDAVDAPHIAFCNSQSGSLGYAVKSGAGWTSEIVDGGGDVAGYPSLALDAQGTPSVAYYDANAGLRFAERTAP